MGFELRRLLAVASPRFARAARFPTVAASAVATPPQLVSVATRLRGPTGVYAWYAPSTARWLRLLPWQTPSALWGLGVSGRPYRAVLFSRLRLPFIVRLVVRPCRGLVVVVSFCLSCLRRFGLFWPCWGSRFALCASAVGSASSGGGPPPRPRSLRGPGSPLRRSPPSFGRVAACSAARFPSSAPRYARASGSAVSGFALLRFCRLRAAPFLGSRSPCRSLRPSGVSAFA